MSVSEASERRQLWLRAGKRRRRRIQLCRLLLILGFFLFWELGTARGLIDAFIVSSPSRMLETLLSLCRSGELWRHLWVSVAETAAGFLLGTALGTLIAVALWWSDFLRSVLEPVLIVLNALPKTALGPVFIVWMGAGMGSIIAMTLAISLIVTVLDVLGGFLSTDSEQLQLLQTMGASRLQQLTKLVIPANLDTLMNALKVNVGLSWVGAIMGEFLVSRAGLGYLIVYGSQVFRMDLVMTTVLLLGVSAALMYRLVLFFESRLKKHFGVMG